MRLPKTKPRAARGQVDQLPADLQEEILTRAIAGKTWASIRAWLRAEHRCYIASDSSFSHWYSRRLLQQDVRDAMAQHTAQVDGMLEALRAEIPDMPMERLERFGQAAFMTLAMKSQDPSVWTRVYQLRLKERALAVEEGKLEILRRKAEQADQAKAVSESAALTPDEKLARIKQVFGIAA